MTEFFRALFAPENIFLRTALLGGLLASISCGIIGSYVVSRRITYVADGIAHSVLGGIGAAGYFAVVWHIGWLTPLHGAIVAALLAAGLIGTAGFWAKQREDTVISAIWAIGMAIGILFIAATPGYSVDPMSYLFGNVLMISRADILLMIIVDVLVVGLIALFYKPILASCFDKELAELRGINASAYYLLLLVLTALTVVALVTVVGVVLVIALLALPAASANYYTKTFGRMIFLAIIFSAAFVVIGLGVSYNFNVPSGAAIVVIAGLFYLASSLSSITRKKAG